MRLFIRQTLAIDYLDQPISGRVDGGSAAETVDSGSIPGRVKSKPKNWYA